MTLQRSLLPQLQRSRRLGIFVALVVFQSVTVLLHKQTSVLLPPLPRDLSDPFVLASEPHGQEDLEPMSRIFLEGRATYTGECRRFKLTNTTWGQSVAPFVDKVGAKILVEQMGTAVKIVPTIAVYDTANISDFDAMYMKALPDSIIKPAHATGWTAQVQNKSYVCFKGCKQETLKFQSWLGEPSEIEQAHKVAKKVMQYTLSDVPSPEFQKKEPQYGFVPRRVLIEHRLPVERMKEYHWWIANGQPVFVCIRCDEGRTKRGSYYSSAFQKLEITSVLEPCLHLSRPKTWEKMISIVKKMGERVPGVACIDLYADDWDVYFSEITFTRGKCRTYFQPLVADALLYAMSNDILAAKSITADYVEKTVADRSWVHVSFDLGEPLLSTNKVVNATGFPSGPDLCGNQTTANSSVCDHTIDSVASWDLHCVISKENALTAVGQSKIRTIGRLVQKIDWLLVLGLVVLLVFVKFGHKTRQLDQPGSQVFHCFLYLAAVAVFKTFQTNSAGLLSPRPIWYTVVESYQAFKIVHPVTSPAIAISHFATYWISVGAFFSKRLTTMLILWCLYEVCTAFVNEYFHFGEEDDSVRCMRVSFILYTKEYAINDVVRVYLLPPLFVYGYLLPKMMLYWFGPYGMFLVCTISAGLGTMLSLSTCRKRSSCGATLCPHTSTRIER